MASNVETTPASSSSTQAPNATVSQRAQQIERFLERNQLKGNKKRVFLNAVSASNAKVPLDKVLDMLVKNADNASPFKNYKRPKKASAAKVLEPAPVESPPDFKFYGGLNIKSGHGFVPLLAKNVPIDWARSVVDAFRSSSPAKLSNRLEFENKYKTKHPCLGFIRSVMNSIAYIKMLTDIRTIAVQDQFKEDIRITFMLPSLDPGHLYNTVLAFLNGERNADFAAGLRRHQRKVIITMVNPLAPDKFKAQKRFNSDLIQWECDAEYRPGLNDYVVDYGYYLIRPEEAPDQRVLCLYASVPKTSSGGAVLNGSTTPEVTTSVTELIKFVYDDGMTISALAPLDLTTLKSKDGGRAAKLDFRCGYALNNWSLSLYEVAFNVKENPDYKLYASRSFGGSKRVMTTSKIVESGPADPNRAGLVRVSEKKAEKIPIKTKPVKETYTATELDAILGIDQDKKPRATVAERCAKVKMHTPPPKTRRERELFLPSPVSLTTRVPEFPQPPPPPPEIAPKPPKGSKTSGPDEPQQPEGAEVDEESRETSEGERVSRSNAMSNTITWAMRRMLAFPVSYGFMGLENPPAPTDPREVAVIDAYTTSSCTPEGTVIQKRGLENTLCRMLQKKEPFTAAQPLTVEEFRATISKHREYIQMLFAQDVINYYKAQALWLYHLFKPLVHVMGGGLVFLFVGLRLGIIKPFFATVGANSMSTKLLNTIHVCIVAPIVEELIKKMLEKYLGRFLTALLFGYGDCLGNKQANLAGQTLLHFSLMGPENVTTRIKAHASWNTFVVFQQVIASYTALVGQAYRQLKEIPNIDQYPLPEEALPRIEEIYKNHRSRVSEIEDPSGIAEFVQQPAVRKVASTVYSTVSGWLRWVPESLRNSLPSHGAVKWDRLFEMTSDVVAGLPHFLYKSKKNKSPFMVISSKADCENPTSVHTKSIAAVCPSQLPLGPIHEPNQVRLSGDTPCCAVMTNSYAPLFRVVGIRDAEHLVQVTTFGNCHHVMLQSATSRMAGVPPLFRGLANPYEEQLLCEDRWRRHISHNSFGVFDSDGPLPTYHVPLLKTTEEWLQRYPVGLRKAMMEAYSTHDFDTSHPYDCMPKIEKKTFYPKDIDGIHLTTQTDGRGIFVPKYGFRVEHGPVCVYASDVLKSQRRGRFFYTCGTSEVERAIWFDWATQNEQWCVAYCGDNMIFASKRGLVCVDMKRMDMHVHAASQESVAAYFDHLGMDATASAIRRDVIKRFNYRKGNFKMNIVLRGGQPSGRWDTTIGNSLTVELCARFVLNTINPACDPGALLTAINNGYAYFGFKAESYDLTLDNILSAEFLQQRFYLVDANPYGVQRAPGNRIGRILFRTFWTKDRLSDAKARGLMRGIAMSLYPQNTHVPIINTLLKCILDKTCSVNPYFDNDWRRKRRFTDHIPGGFQFKEHPASKLELAHTLGVGLEEILTLERHLLKTDLGTRLCMDDECQYILHKLAQWDL